MTVESTTNFKKFDFNGVTTVISFTFRCLQSSDLKVYAYPEDLDFDDLEDYLLTEDTDYTVDLDEDGEGGEVTFGSAYDTDTAGLIQNICAITQPADLPTEGNFNEESVETALDRACLINIQQQQDILQSVKIGVEDPLNVPGFTGLKILAEPTASRQSRGLSWNAAGDGFEAGPTNDEVSNAQTYATAAAAAQAGAEAAEDGAETARDQTLVYAAALTGTSVSSLSIATGSKVFVTQAGKQWALGQRLRAASDDGVKIMDGEVTAYAGTSLTLDVDYIESSGTHADWNISIVGERGATGATGSTGAAGQGVPTGGAIRQNLRKISATNYDTEWADTVTLATAQASTSGTSIDFSAIPVGVNEIEVTFAGVSTNGSAAVLVQIGHAGGNVATGYLSGASYMPSGGAISGNNASNGFLVNSVAAGNILHGSVTLTRQNATGHIWTMSHSMGLSSSAGGLCGGGSHSGLPNPLYSVRITTANGTDAFDAGSINIAYK